LIHKEKYTRAFLKAKSLATYDLTHLKMLWDRLYEACAGEAA
jgi:hypothetical protein